MQSSTPIESPYLTAEEAAAYLNFTSVHWFRQAVRRYGIPFKRRGRRLFFTKAELDQFMDVADEATNPRKRRKSDRKH
jgi:excisionase family DNA binding protein